MFTHIALTPEQLGQYNGWVQQYGLGFDFSYHVQDGSELHPVPYIWRVWPESEQTTHLHTVPRLNCTVLYLELFSTPSYTGS